jgi:hypothetical protein
LQLLEKRPSDGALTSLLEGKDYKVRYINILYLLSDRILKILGVIIMIARDMQGLSEDKVDALELKYLLKEACYSVSIFMILSNTFISLE